MTSIVSNDLYSKEVPNVEVSGLFKDYDFRFVQPLDTSLIEANALSLSYWLSKFV